MKRYRVEEATVQQPVIVQADATDAEALSWAKAMEVALAIIDLQMGYLRREKRRLRGMLPPDDLAR